MLQNVLSHKYEHFMPIKIIINISLNYILIV